jgi:hypothetical protein
MIVLKVRALKEKRKGGDRKWPYFRFYSFPEVRRVYSFYSFLRTKIVPAEELSYTK